MNELLEKINATFDQSIESSNDEVALQLKILKGNINTLFNQAMAEDIEVLVPESTNEEAAKSEVPDKKSILVVDDSSVIRNYVEKICGGEYNVEVASGGEEAINTLSKKNVNLLLLDLMMPGKDGFSVLDYLKSEDRNVPTVIISGDTTKETIDRAFTYNVIDMIEKPFPEKTLLEKVRRVLE